MVFFLVVIASPPSSLDASSSSLPHAVAQEAAQIGPPRPSRRAAQRDTSAGASRTTIDCRVAGAHARNTLPVERVGSALVLVVDPAHPPQWSVMSLRRSLRSLARRIVGVAKPNPVGRHGCIHSAVSFVTWNQIEGDYLEFGVYRGESLTEAYHALDRSRRDYAANGFDSPEYKRWQASPPRFFAFDSFEGLPAGTAERPVDFGQGAFGCSEAAFKTNVARDGVDLTRLVTVPGFYDQSLTQDVKRRLKLEKAALVMIDCDLYESTVPVLDFLTDLVGQGTILIFHDWFRFKGRPDCGEQRACREWLARNPHLELIEYWREGTQAVSFLVNLK
jgi:hypothetical protein